MKKLISMIALVAMVAMSSVAFAATDATVSQTVSVESAISLAHDGSGGAQIDCGTTGPTLNLDPFNASPVFVDVDNVCNFVVSSNAVDGFNVTVVENNDPTILLTVYTLIDSVDTVEMIVDGKIDTVGSAGTIEEYGIYTSENNITDAINGTCGAAANAIDNWCPLSPGANGVINGTDDVANGDDFEITLGAAATVATEAGDYVNVLTLTVAAA